MKKVLSALLIMLMLIQTVSFAAADDKIYIEKSTKELVDRLSTLGIFEQFDDEKYFGDNDDVKRSEAAVVISNMLGMKEAGGSALTEIKFYDVPQYREYISAVNYVSGLGIMTGDSAGMFNPDDPMEIAHVYKALVVALGYGWKAEAYGGYPAGYVKVAAELEIANAVSKGINETATRIDFLNMVNAALDAPICKMKSISGDVVDFEVDEDVTVLSEYHDIYVDEGVVENNKTMSFGTEEIEDDIVYISGRKLFVNGVYDVYASFGYQVEYYYRYDKLAEEGYLLSVVPTEDNVEIKVSKPDFDGYADGKITYYNESGKKKDIALDSSAVVFYNGEVTLNISDAINSFEGTLTFIDNDGNNKADVVIAKNYSYDKVKSITAAENKLFLENKVIDLDSYEYVGIAVAATGEETEFAAITSGTVIGYAESTDGKKLNIDVLGSALAVKATSLYTDEFVADDGKKYNTSLLSAEHKALIKPNTAVSIVTMDGYYAVWVTTASETVSLGYLINIATETEFNETVILGVRILATDGEIKAYKAADEKKIILNGKSANIASLKTTLSNIKQEHMLAGDGEVSQFIGFKLNDEGNLTHIYTVNKEDENSPLYLKYGFKRDGLANFNSNAGYGTPRFRSQANSYQGVLNSGGSTQAHPYYTDNFMMTNTHPIFHIPLEDQETADKKMYFVKGYSLYDWDKTQGRQIETYTSSEFGIVPIALVNYINDAPVEGDTSVSVLVSGKVLLVDETYQTLNSDGGVDFVVSGLSEKTVVTYTTDSEKISAEVIESRKAIEDDPNEEPGFTTGDVAMIHRNSVGEIIQMAKAFDRETGNINPNMAPNRTNNLEGTQNQTSMLFLHTYNKPADGFGLEFFEEDLSLGVPNNNKKLLLSLHAMGTGRVNEKAATFMFYDDDEEKVFLGSTQNVVDYQQDPENYTKILGIPQNSDTVVIFYNNYDLNR